MLVWGHNMLVRNGQNAGMEWTQNDDTCTLNRIQHICILAQVRWEGWFVVSVVIEEGWIWLPYP